MILNEANAISTAYQRLDLLEAPTALALKSALKAYLRARIDLYQTGIGFSLWRGAEVASDEHLARISRLNHAIWDGAVKACAPADQKAVCVLVLPSLSSMFDTARSRDGANERHPPHVLYVMLFGLGLGGSLLAGFGMAATKNRSWVHMTIFASALAVALFVVTDLSIRVSASSASIVSVTSSTPSKIRCGDEPCVACCGAAGGCRLARSPHGAKPPRKRRRARCGKRCPRLDLSGLRSRIRLRRIRELHPGYNSKRENQNAVRWRIAAESVPSSR